MHRQFFKRQSQNADYVQTHCNDRINAFHFACRKWYLYNNPNYWYSIFVPILKLEQISIITPIQKNLFLYLYK